MIEQFKQLPRAMQAVMGVLAAAAVFALAALIDPRAVKVLLIGVVVILCALLVWFWYQRRKARKRAQALTGQIAQNTGSAPNAISDPAGRAKLDDLRRNFQGGVDKFRAAGKDLYSLPWYVVCGEPGSGKSEAVRHCGVGFPPGLQDEMQGAGGTLNMHWWFTNYAVLLDTAGKLLFQEAPAGTTTEWTEFLSLLKKSRPNCPINGLLLVIPSESLIKDSFEEIQKKASKIVRQLDQIQRILDVRFPVFVLVTKCDLINGFREFFSGIKDPQLQHQITGWSNPDPLDTPFQPESVDRHLDTVVNRISRRRLGLLKDPISLEGSARRIDEVDSLFSLPASIAALGPRLRRYLETIFVAGEWSSKPLFLRGIYFTSALTEGAALDQEIAVALGLPVESLPEGKAWVRERSFFLRDLFLQKIFKERGLVTRASNTRKQRRRQQMVLGGVVIVGLLALLGFSWFGASSLRQSIGAERDLWTAAAGGWSERYWRPIIKPLFQGSLKYAYTGAEPVEVGNAKMPLVELHQELQRLAARPVRVPWVFKPMETLVMGANTKRREAQRVVYDAGVVLPLLDAARLRLERSGEPWMPGGERQLALLVQLEGLIHLRGVEGYANEASAEDFIGPLLAPWLADAPIPEPLLRVFDWTYHGGGAGKGQWPAAWLSAGKTLRENRPIDVGWASFAKFLEHEQSARLSGLDLVRDGRLAAGAFLNAERDFQRAALAPRTNATWSDEVTRRFAALGEQQKALDALVGKAAGSSNFGADGFSLAGGYTSLVEASRQQGTTATKPLAMVLAQQKLASEKAESLSGAESDFTLFRDVRRRLGELSRTLAGTTEQAFSATEQAELPALDAAVFRASIDPAQRVFSYRCDVYRDALALLSPISGETPAIIGQLGEVIGQIGKQQDALRQRIDKYTGGGSDDFQPAARQLLVAVGEGAHERVADMYVASIEREFDAHTGYPLTRTGRELTPEQVKTVVAVAAKVSGDVATPGLSAPLKKRLETATERIGRTAQFAAALAPGPDGAPRKFRLILPNESEQRKAIAGAGAAASGAGFAGRVYRTVRIGNKVLKPIWEKGDAAPWVTGVVSDRLPTLEFFEGPDPKPDADAKHTFGGDWGVLRALEGGAQRHPDGKRWDLLVTLRDDKGESRLQLTLELDAPLPPVEQWPR